MFAGYHYTVNPKKPGYDGLWGTHPEFGLMRGTENIIGTSATQRGKALRSGAYAIFMNRLHLLMKWVVSFSISSRFGPPRGRRGDGVFTRPRRRDAGVAAT